MAWLKRLNFNADDVEQSPSRESRVENRESRVACLVFVLKVLMVFWALLFLCPWEQQGKERGEKGEEG